MIRRSGCKCAFIRAVQAVAILCLLAYPGTSHAKPLEQIPLIVATLQNDITQVRHLLKTGANPNEYDAHRNTALILTARDGRVEIARLLIAAGADPGWIDGELVTPLILAAYKNHIEIVKLLLARKVDRSQRDQWGRVASDYAKRRGAHDPIYQLLVK